MLKTYVQNLCKTYRGTGQAVFLMKRCKYLPISVVKVRPLRLLKINQIVIDRITNSAGQVIRYVKNSQVAMLIPLQKI